MCKQRLLPGTLCHMIPRVNPDGFALAGSMGSILLALILHHCRDVAGALSQILTSAVLVSLRSEVTY